MNMDNTTKAGYYKQPAASAGLAGGLAAAQAAAHRYAQTGQVDEGQQIGVKQSEIERQMATLAKAVEVTDKQAHILRERLEGRVLAPASPAVQAASEPTTMRPPVITGLGGELESLIVQLKSLHDMLQDMTHRLEV